MDIATHRIHAILLCLLLGLLLSRAWGDEVRPLRVIDSGIAESIPIAAAWIRSEPSLTGLVVPSREGWGGVQPSHVKKMIRIYFPRTFEELASYDFFLFAQVDMTYFTGTQDRWMHDAIAERGLGGLNTRSVMSMIPSYSYPWVDSLLSQAFPNDPLAVVQHDYYRMNNQALGPMVVNDDEAVAPIVRPFKDQIERVLFSYRGVVTSPRPGSTIYTWVKTDLRELGNPLLGYIAHLFQWTYGEGTTFTTMDMLTDRFWRGDENPFSLDIVANIIWHSCGRELPADAMMVHLLRGRFLAFDLMKSNLVSVLEFAERFGANTNRIYDHLQEIESGKGEADRSYLQGNFEESNAMMDEIIGDLEGLDGEAVRLKDRALMWVYIIEWLVAASTLIVSGVLLWTLMVRRRLYRQIGATRFRST
jgi:hypothetical protein